MVLIDLQLNSATFLASCIHLEFLKILTELATFLVWRFHILYSQILEIDTNIIQYECSINPTGVY